MSRDEFNITLDVAGRSYRVPVSRGDQQTEFLYREAAKRVQQYLALYRQHFSKSLEEIDLLSMAAIHLAWDAVRLETQCDPEAYSQTIQRLTDTLEDYLKKKE